MFLDFASLNTTINNKLLYNIIDTYNLKCYIGVGRYIVGQMRIKTNERLCNPDKK